jgi:hypothetical protein
LLWPPKSRKNFNVGGTDFSEKISRVRLANGYLLCSWHLIPLFGLWSAKVCRAKLNFGSQAGGAVDNSGAKRIDGVMYHHEAND